MPSITAYILAIFSIIISVKAQTEKNALAQMTLANGVEIDVRITDTLTTIILCCPDQSAWCAVGFGGNTMLNTYAIIAEPSGDNQLTVQEYTLGAAAAGSSCCQAITLDSNDVFPGSDDKICAKMTRATTNSNAKVYDFPSGPFSASEQIDIISAIGNSKTYADSGMASKLKNIKLVFNPGTAAPTPEPTEEKPVLKSAESKSAVCFSSDSWVVTYPNFEKKSIGELEIYDKILTYDEINDKFFWDELLVKLHFNKGEFLNDVLVPMREFILNNGEILSMTDSHLLYVGHSGLHRADEVRLGDKLKIFDGTYADVIGIKEVMKYPRNMITYNGNLVINGVAISTFTDTIWGESENWGKYLRHVMKYGYEYNMWRYPAYYAAKLWTEYASVDYKDRVLRFYMDEERDDSNDDKTSWFSWFFSYS